jgi:hypothetical protein
MSSYVGLSEMRGKSVKPANMASTVRTAEVILVQSVWFLEQTCDTTWDVPNDNTGPSITSYL